MSYLVSRHFGFLIATIALSLASSAFAVEGEREPASVPPPKAEAAKVGEVLFNFSGFAWLELESSQNFGYGVTTSTPDFQSSSQTFSNFMSNLQFTAERAQTKLTAVFEIGEVIDGDNSSGGAQGARQRVTEVRNVFLTHKLDESWSVRGGIMPILSDPNAFILSDHYMSEAVDYAGNESSGSFWIAKAYSDRPGVNSASTDHVNPDQYAGLNGKLPLGQDTQANLFGVYRKTIETLYDASASATTTGNSTYHWLGATIESKIGDTLSLQGTYIFNSGHFEGDRNGPKDDLSASLADLKLMASLPESKVDFLLEGIMTSGSNDSIAPGQTVQTIGSRKSFSSPDPGAAYLLSVATSDGADEAPGSAKQSVIGNLSQASGLQVYVVKATKAFTSRFSAYARAGLLKASSKNLATDSDDMGFEVDIGTTYELSPGTIWQIDFGQLTPGSYYSNREAATLATSRLRFAF